MMEKIISRKERNKEFGPDTARVRRCLFLIAANASWLFILFGATANASSVEERLDQLNRLPERARAEALEKEARKEDEVVWYAAMASDRAGEVNQPGISRSGYGPRSRPKGMFYPLWKPQQFCARSKLRGILD